VSGTSLTILMEKEGKRVGTLKKLAEIARKEIEVKIAKGELGWKDIRDPAFEGFCQEYLSYLKVNTRPTTYIRYRNCLDNFSSFLKRYVGSSLRLSQISFSLIERYKKERIQVVKPRTVNIELKVLKALFNYAIKCRCASKNPFNEVPFFRAPI